MIAVTMHTPTYAVKSKHLAESASRVGVRIVDHTVDPAVNWRRTTHKKALVIHAALAKFKDDDVLWVDADSVFHEYPIAVHRMPEHAMVAAFNHGGFLWGSTLWFRRGLSSRILVRQWISQNLDTPQYSADNNLWAVLKNGKHPHYHKLPFSYCECEHPELWDLKPVEHPVIHHYGSFTGQEKYSGIRHPLVKE